MKYLLDTNILSQLMKKRPLPHLKSRLAAEDPHSLITSCICAMELRYGSALREDFESFWEKILQEILSRVKILPLGYEEVLIAGEILANLQKAGQPIGIEDVLIASTALHHGCTLVSANIRHFQRIDGLNIENWLQ